MFDLGKTFRDAKRALLGRPDEKTGDFGERVAVEFLCRLPGYRIVARNWRSPRDRRDELDIVCLDGDILVFVEVKTRAGRALVQGYYAVTKKKKEILLRAAKDYLRNLPPSKRPTAIRFDIIEVSTTAGAPEVRHYENVPLFPKYFAP